MTVCVVLTYRKYSIQPGRGGGAREECAGGRGAVYVLMSVSHVFGPVWQYQQAESNIPAQGEEYDAATRFETLQAMTRSTLWAQTGLLIGNWHAKIQVKVSIRCP